MPSTSCPGCGRTIQLSMADLSRVIECDACGMKFRPLGGGPLPAVDAAPPREASEKAAQLHPVRSRSVVNPRAKMGMLAAGLAVGLLLLGICLALFSTESGVRRSGADETGENTATWTAQNLYRLFQEDRAKVAALEFKRVQICGPLKRSAYSRGYDVRFVGVLQSYYIIWRLDCPVDIQHSDQSKEEIWIVFSGKRDFSQRFIEHSESLALTSLSMPDVTVSGTLRIKTLDRLNSDYFPTTTGIPSGREERLVLENARLLNW
jgi:hypothetical protein